VYITVFVKNWI